jgi:hypothetical protein
VTRPAVRQPLLFPDAAEPIPDVPDRERYCRACGSLDVSIGRERGPHYAEIRCRECGQVTWPPKPRGAEKRGGR